LYPIFVIKLPQAQSANARRCHFSLFATIFLTSSVSTPIAWFSSTSRFESLCWKSARAVATRSCANATFRRAFALFFDPFRFRDNAMAAPQIAISPLQQTRIGVFLPVLSAISDRSPTSAPTTDASGITSAGAGASVSSSNSSAAKYFPDRDRETVIDLRVPGVRRCTIAGMRPGIFGIVIPVPTPVFPEQW
jgi:hypothetical protein